MNWNLGLNFYSTDPILFEPNELASKEFTKYIADNKYHIYVVCKRKNFFFESCELDGDFCKTTLYYLDDKRNKEYLRYRHPNNLFIDSWKDGIYQVTIDGKDKTEIRDFDLISNFNFLENDLLGDKEKNSLPSDLEVLYIGQAFGRTTVKTIDYRISNHDKVQKIALDILRKGTNEEVLIIGLKIKTNDFGTSFVSLGSDTKAPTVESLMELVTKAKKRLTNGQEVTVFEASLIKYFKPDLNTEYKETFPSKDFTSYGELYDTDFDYSAMAVDSRQIGVRLYSQEITERKYLHTLHYPLTTKSDKETLFEYLYELNDEQ